MRKNVVTGKTATVLFVAIHVVKRHFLPTSDVTIDLRTPTGFSTDTIFCTQDLTKGVQLDGVVASFLGFQEAFVVIRVAAHVCNLLTGLEFCHDVLPHYAVTRVGNGVIVTPHAGLNERNSWESLRQLLELVLIEPVIELPYHLAWLIVLRQPYG